MSAMPARVSCVVIQCKLRLDSCPNVWCILACHDVLVVRQLWWWSVISMHVGSGSAVALCSATVACLPGPWEIALVGMTSISLLLHVCESCAVHDCAQDIVSMCVHL